MLVGFFSAHVANIHFYDQGFLKGFVSIFKVTICILTHDSIERPELFGMRWLNLCSFISLDGCLTIVRLYPTQAEILLLKFTMAVRIRGFK